MKESETKKAAQKESICLEVRDVVKRFPGVTAVDHVSLQIEEGEIFSFLGPSGCGKSTLLRLVAGLENQDQGDIFIAGKVVNDLPPYKRDCSTVFQSHALFPHMSVEKNIGFGLVERKIPKAEIRKRVMDKINLVNLTGLEDRFPHQLSGGQMQRVALARSLVLEPSVLLLDEPLAALDRKLRKEMQVELRRIQREVGTTFLNVTHDQKEALSLSDRIAVMNAGVLLQIGTPNDIYERPRTKFVAEFMGATNIFDGRVAGTEDGMIEIKTPGGIRMFACDPKGMAHQDISGCSIHPELVQLMPSKDAAPSIDPRTKTVMQGRVHEVIYLGDFSEITVRLEGVDRLLTVFQTRTGEGVIRRLAKDEPVAVQWDCHHTNVLVE